MSSSFSPEHQGPSGSGFDGGGSDTDSKSPGLMSLDFLRSLTEKQIKRGTDGNPPKRRGPKPDSKPAMTRRQELNRQAQRTHRERKELYVKALEEEVLRLKEVFSNISQDKEKVSEENKQLRQLLVSHGIPYATFGIQDDGLSTRSGGYTTSASPSGYSHGQASRSVFTPPLTANSSVPSASPSYAPSHMTGVHMSPAPVQGRAANSNVDYDQAGIDFVLTLERPCMHHMPWLLERSGDMGGEPCGHALMASCPPEPFPELTSEIPFGSSHVTGDVTDGQKTWELTKGDLATLLALSKRLDLDGEITPVMAWGRIMAHPQFKQASAEDFRKLADELTTKIRCYGFGAVMEEFEVRDAMENIFGDPMSD